jgi:uncharacterized protein YutE (UPF0331/DUF86 family)
MTKGNISDAVISQKALWVRRMVTALKELPLQSKKEFLDDQRNVAAAESYLRRALEALFDIGRHILAKGFAFPTAEYKEISEALHEKKILSIEEKELLKRMAGYRNRLVHFYHEVGPEELYEVCTLHSDEITALLDTLLKWLRRRKTSRK